MDPLSRLLAIDRDPTHWAVRIFQPDLPCAKFFEPKANLTLILLATILNTTSEWDGIDEDEEETEQREDAESKIEEAVMQSTALTTTTIPTTTKDFCHCEMEIYGPEVLEGVLKSPNYPSLLCETGKCIYKVI
ncbi:hypothetical protein B9Z55_023225 [Caenorhabditis nigoni]|nr:hypothetical protein B9Z55_023225 [Caenorhabditis nigoni]